MAGNKAVFAALIIVGGVLIMRDAMALDIELAAQNPNVRAFLAMIRRFESGGRYDVIYGGQLFSDFSKHPNMRVPFMNPRTQKRDFSTAAGAYQITFPTWLSIQAAAPFPDFLPATQDRAAIVLLRLRGALGYIIDGDFENALRVASKTWASLPYTDSKQAHVSLVLALNEYTNQGGSTT